MPRLYADLGRRCAGASHLSASAGCRRSSPGLVDRRRPRRQSVRRRARRSRCATQQAAARLRALPRRSASARARARLSTRLVSTPAEVLALAARSGDDLAPSAGRAVSPGDLGIYARLAATRRRSKPTRARARRSAELRRTTNGRELSADLRRDRARRLEAQARRALADGRLRRCGARSTCSASTSRRSTCGRTPTCTRRSGRASCCSARGVHRLTRCMDESARVDAARRASSPAAAAALAASRLLERARIGARDRRAAAAGPAPLRRAARCRTT